MESMPAESIAASSLLFVASSYNEDGTKYLESGRLLTDMFTFDVEAEHDDYIDGGEGDDGKILHE